MNCIDKYIGFRSVNVYNMGKLLTYSDQRALLYNTGVSSCWYAPYLDDKMAQWSPDILFPL